MTDMTMQQIENIIAKANPRTQRQFLADLPRLLKLSDMALLKLAEDSFDFWDNPDDAIYDEL